MNQINNDKHNRPDPVDRALTLMGAQQWDGSGRNLRVEDAIAGQQIGSGSMKRRKKMIVAGIAVGLLGATAIAAAVHELVQFRAIVVDQNGNQVELNGTIETSDGNGTKAVTLPDGRTGTVTVSGDGQQKTIEVSVDGNAAKPASTTPEPKH